MANPCDLERLEHAKYERMWAHSQYRHNSPADHLYFIYDLAFREMRTGDRLIDFGCGTGKVTPFFLDRGLSIDLVDIAPNALNPEIEALLTFMPCYFTQACLWNLPESLRPADWILCIDVLEHIPEEKVDEVLLAMAKRTAKGGLLQIYLEDEPFGSLINDTLHLCVRSREWWIKKIETYWHVRLFSPEVESCVRMVALLGPGLAYEKSSD